MGLDEAYLGLRGIYDISKRQGPSMHTISPRLEGLGFSTVWGEDL